MIPDKIELEVVTPERRVLARSVDEVILPSVDGYMGVRPGHAPLLALLDIGQVSIREGDREEHLAVAGGFVEVLRDRVRILAETAERAAEIDPERARAAKERAEEQLREKLSEGAFREAEASLKKAVSRLDVHRRARG